jgi:hypothetical protein
VEDTNSGADGKWDGSTLTLKDKLVTFSKAQKNLPQKFHLDGDPEKWRS